MSTRGELDELEEANIHLGFEWGLDRAVGKGRRADVLDEEFLYELHRRMFGEVWDWAGAVRRTDKNIGIDKHRTWGRSGATSTKDLRSRYLTALRAADGGDMVPLLVFALS